MFERYTEQARRAIFFARYTAAHQRAERITAAHLLIGLCWEGKVLTSEIGSLKGRIPELCALLGLQWPFGTASKKQLHAEMPLDNNSKIALAYAAEEAGQDGQFWIDTDHLLRGLLRFPNEACTALQSIQLDLATVRVASVRHRAEHPPQPALSSIQVSRGAGLPPRLVARPFLTLAALALVEILVLLLVAWLK